MNQAVQMNNAEGANNPKITFKKLLDLADSPMGKPIIYLIQATHSIAGTALMMIATLARVGYRSMESYKAETDKGEEAAV